MSNGRSAIRKDDPRERYANDAEFKTLVDTFFGLIMNVRNRFTPFELRQALVLALIRYEEMTLRPLSFKLSPRIDTSWEKELEREPPKTIKQLLNNLFGKKEI